MNVNALATDWVSNVNTGACSYYRIHMPARWCDWNVKEVPPLHVRIDNARYGDWSLRWRDESLCDLLVTQRVNAEPHWNYFIYRCHRNEEKYIPIVLTLDDNYFEIPKSNPSYEIYQDGQPARRFIERQISQADAVIVTRKHLQRVYQAHNRNIYVIPNMIEPWMHPQPGDARQSKRRNDEEIRIGWAGGYSHDEDFSQFAEAFSAVAKRHPRVVFCAMGFESFGLQLSIPLHQWHFCGHERPHYNYTKMLYDADLDIAVAPLFSHNFNRCKSNIRVLENGLCGYAMIASKAFDLPYQEVIVDGENGFLATTKDEWEDKLEQLIADAELRKTFGRRLYETVIRDWSIENHHAIWSEALEEIHARAIASPKHQNPKPAGAGKP